jgi:adenine-specific DNA-methyltransferase
MASKHARTRKKSCSDKFILLFHIVDKILKDSGFYESDLTDKIILDPACGDGRFLVPIVEYIIENTHTSQIKSRLEQIHGWDIDKEAIKLCRQNLDNLIKPLGIAVDWNLKRCDALKQKNTKKRFHFIVGNPPYIRIQHLPEEQRKFIQNQFSFCQSGSTDAYLAFFQLASMLLAEDGICGFITPNSWLTSETGKPLRAYFEQNNNLSHSYQLRSNSCFWKYRYLRCNHDFRKEPVRANFISSSASTLILNTMAEKYLFQN